MGRGAGPEALRPAHVSARLTSITQHMLNVRRFVAVGDGPVARAARAVHRAARQVHLPVPRAVGRPVHMLHTLIRDTYYGASRLLICEPLFKAACRSYGRNVRTGVFVHFVLGDGDIIVGDDSCIDGKSSFVFGARFSERPVLSIGRRTYVGHQCSFAVASQITVGSDCYIATGCFFLDSPGHPLDPARRLAHLPPDAEQVRPVVIGDNVWIGTQAMIMPGVTIGEGSVVAARAVVTADVPPYTVVGGTPARVIKRLDAPRAGVLQMAGTLTPVPA